MNLSSEELAGISANESFLGFTTVPIVQTYTRGRIKDKVRAKGILNHEAYTRVEYVKSTDEILTVNA